MEKNIITIIIFAFACIFIYFFFLRSTPQNSTRLNINGTTYTLEVAKTIAQKTKGLMGRTSLCANCGMIFVSNFEMPQAFWMKNTFIPLDIIFLDKEGTVINIENALPEAKAADNSYRLYQSSRPAKYIIEINAGDCQKINLKPYDKINLPQL